MGGCKGEEGGGVGVRGMSVGEEKGCGRKGDERNGERGGRVAAVHDRRAGGKIKYPARGVHAACSTRLAGRHRTYLCCGAGAWRRRPPSPGAEGWRWPAAAPPASCPAPSVRGAEPGGAREELRAGTAGGVLGGQRGPAWERCVVSRPKSDCEDSQCVGAALTGTASTTGTCRDEDGECEGVRGFRVGGQIS